MATRLARLGGGSWRKASSLAPPLVVALLPKCPVCIAAHGAVLGSAGLGGAASGPWMRWVALGFLGAALWMLARGARERRGYRPFALGCAAAGPIVAELFHKHAPAAGHAHHHAAAPEPHSQVILWTGVALLVAASLWNAWPRKEGLAAVAHGDCSRAKC
jgi:mercuric ion transport protein